MLNVAVTGNIAAGKSTVVDWFREWGATIIDADQLVRDVQQPGSEVLRAIAQRFGDDVIRADGSLDRSRLRRLVFKDEAAVAALNDIVHPAVRERRDALSREAASRNTPVLVNDIPLLFEVLDPRDFDVVVLVDAPRSVRRDRLVSLRGLSPDDADRLIDSQWSPDLKRDRSDLVIDNGGSLEELRAKTLAAWQTILQRAKQEQRDSNTAVDSESTAK